ISRGAGHFQARDTVTASVWYKSDSQTMALLFLGDSSGLHSYSSQQMATAYGDNGWRKLTVSMTLSEAPHLSVHLSGDRDGAHHAAGHAVLFDDVTVSSAQRGGVGQDGFESGLGAWQGAGEPITVTMAGVPVNGGEWTADTLSAYVRQRPANTQDQIHRQTYDAAGDPL
ncbi:hypothetical protein C3E98_039120, partial [Pseudomonas sp. MWU13-2625]